MNNLLRIEDLTNNPMPRVPVCLCLDTSGSMGKVEDGSYVETGRREFNDGQWWDIVEGGKTRIGELQKGLELLYETLKKDEVAAYSAEFSVVTFDDVARCILDFDSLIRQDHVPELKANGNTAMGEGVNLALDLLDKRTKEYRDAGVDYYKPWLILMGDGGPNGNAQQLEAAIERVSRMIDSKKLTVFAIGIGASADMHTLGRFSPKRDAVRLQGLKFEEFFKWVSRSVSKTSQSIPGEAVQLDNISGWATLD